MTIDQMRAEIAKRYPSENWQKKCKGMHSRQVVAIYYSFMARDMADKSIKKVSEGSLPCDKGNYRQITLFDYFGYKMAPKIERTQEKQPV